ncbi:RING finger protein PSH1 [Diplonema papillatum]|nr:RING finger protein PSH1 [Diplonema papillatum]
MTASKNGGRSVNMLGRLTPSAADPIAPPSLHAYSRKKELAASSEGKPAAAVAGHCCAVCEEVMLAPARGPVMLVPCGHTFCAPCVEKWQRTRSECPLCRAPSTDAVPNHALRLLIDRSRPDFDASTATALDASIDGSPDRILEHCTPDNAEQVRRYMSQYSLSTARWSILLAEQDSLRADLDKVVQGADVDKKVADYLSTEAAQLAEEVTRLTQDLDVVSKQLAEKRASIDEADDEKRRILTRVDALQQQIVAHEKESFKAQTILSHLAPTLQL